MPKSGPLGFVRGAPSNGRPYRYDSLLQLAMRDAALFDQPLELAQFLLRLAQRDRNAAFLSLQQLFAFHHHERAVQRKDSGNPVLAPVFMNV